MKYNNLLLCLIVSAVALSPQLAPADITPMDYSAPPSGGVISPKSPHPTIRLDDQEVIIRLQPSTYTVDAVFHLFNTGGTATEWIGFPKNVTGRQPGPYGYVMDFVEFRVSVNDLAIPFRDERDLAKDARWIKAGPRTPRHKNRESRWLAGQATFPGNAVTTVRVTYEAPYSDCGFMCKQADYIYGTGGYWKDAINKAVFIVDRTENPSASDHASFPGIEQGKYSVRRRSISENVTRYEMTDFDPDPESVLTINVSHRASRAGRGPEFDHFGLASAAANGRMEEVVAALEKGADANFLHAAFGSPLMAAARRGHLKIVELLVKKGADVNARTEDGRTALTETMQWAHMGMGQLEVMRFLKAKGAEPATLVEAAFIGDMDAVQRYLAEGADLNSNPKSGRPTPLMAAAEGGQQDVVKLLLEKGADIAAKDRQGQTALIKAAQGGHAEVLKVLPKRGADANDRDVHHRTVLNHALWLRGHTEAARVLLEAGAEVNARSGPGDQTAIMLAAESGQLEAVKLLLENGADVNAMSEPSGETALSMAKGRDAEEIVEVLKAHGAKR